MGMTSIELEILWAERQQRYAMRRISGVFRPLDDKEISSVIAYRRAEADLLEKRDRAEALTALAQWKPPVGELR